VEVHVVRGMGEGQPEGFSVHEMRLCQLSVVLWLRTYRRGTQIIADNISPPEGGSGYEPLCSRESEALSGFLESIL
jgi:hypothetical protein